MQVQSGEPWELLKNKKLCSNFKSRRVFKGHGCGLKNITRSPKIPKTENLGTQWLSLYENVKFFWLPKGKS